MRRITAKMSVYVHVHEQHFDRAEMKMEEKHRPDCHNLPLFPRSSSSPSPPLLAMPMCFDNEDIFPHFLSNAVN